MGFEEESIFLKQPEVQYPDIYHNYLLEGEYLYALINPDPNVYVYKVADSFRLEYNIELYPENYKRLSDRENQDVNRAIAVNSSFNGILKDGLYLIATYTTGIPEDQYPKSGLGISGINEVSSTYDRLYLSIYDQRGKKIMKDVKAPFEVASIKKRMDEGTFIAVPHSGRVEKRDKVIFYVVQLV